MSKGSTGGHGFAFPVDEYLVRSVCNDVGLQPHGTGGGSDNPFKGVSPGWQWAYELVETFVAEWDENWAERWEDDPGDLAHEIADGAVSGSPYTYDRALIWADLGGGSNVSSWVQEMGVYEEDGSASSDIEEYITADLYGAALALAHRIAELVAEAWEEYEQPRDENE